MARIPMTGGFSGFVPLNNSAVAERNLLTGDLRAIPGRPIAKPQPGSPAFTTMAAPVATMGPQAAGDGKTVATIGSRQRRRNKVAEALGGELMQQGSMTTPVQHWAQGLARVGQGLIGGTLVGRGERAQAAGEDAAAQAYRQLFAGGRAPKTEELAAFVGDQPYATEGQQQVAGAYLTSALKDISNFRPLTADEKATYGIDPKTPAQIDTRTGKVQTLSEKGVTINMPSESERTGGVLATSIGKDFDVVMQNFDALADETSQVGTEVGEMPLGGAIGRWMQTPQYQRAYGALSNIVWMHAYATTGAAMSPKEVERKVLSVMPQLGDDASVLADKKARVGAFVDAINQKAGRSGVRIETGGGGGDDETPAAEGDFFTDSDTFDNTDDIPEGVPFYDDQTGEKFIKRNGQVIKVQ